MNNPNNPNNNLNTGDEPEEEEDEDSTYIQEIGKQNSVTSPPLPLLLPEIRALGFELKEQIGKGHFSDVYRATWTKMPGAGIACKRMKLEEVDEDWKEKCLGRELEIIMKLKHRNIINVHKTFRSERLVFIFMQMADNGSIREYMFKNKYPVKENQAKIWFADLMAGVSYMHSRGVAHRDIKLDNFLLNHEFTALLSDFGFAVIDVNNSKIMRETMCGTFEYMAPEVHSAGPQSLYDAKKADIYSMGVCLYEMINYDKPFDSSSVQNQLSQLIRLKKKRIFRYHSKIEQILSDNIRDLVFKILEPNPQKRITIPQILRHKALQT